jgi:hypothetical protein
LQAVFLPGVRRSGVDHRLLVAGLVVGQTLRVFVESLTHARHVTVAEDAEAPGEEALLHSVALDVLVSQEAHQRLSHRQPRSTH